MKKHHILILALTLLFGAKASAQEWEYSMNMFNDSIYFRDTKELPNGEILLFATSMYPNQTRYPSLFRFSKSGTFLGRKDYFRHAFWGEVPFCITDDDGTNYLMMAYSPDHDTASFNYFHNYDNPPDYAFIGLYKVDENFDIIETHELHIPIDTLDLPPCYGCLLNYDSGSLLLLQAKKDGDAIVGAYIKQPTYDYINPRGNDSIFFFRMDFEGNMLQRMGYKTESQGGTFGSEWMYDQLIKVDDGYAFCYDACPLVNYGRESEGQDRYGCPGRVYYMDSDFRIQDMKVFHVDGPIDFFQQLSVAASDHNTFYASFDYQKNQNGVLGCGLYEYGLDANGTGTLPIVRYITRTSSGWDDCALINGVDIAPDNSLYYAYTLGSATNKYNFFIEHLTPDLDTIRRLVYVDSTLYCSPLLYSLRLTEDGGALAVIRTQHFDSESSEMVQFTKVLKFPAEDFVSIGETYDNNLNVAIAYPNPTSGQVIVTGKDLKTAEVINTLGQCVATTKGKGSITIDLSQQPPGVYFLNITDEEGRKCVRKVVKE